VPLGRFGTEAETSSAIVFLLSPAASFISGDVLRVDGARPQVRMGWPMRAPDEAARQRDAVKPFEGFHRAAVPKVFQDPHPSPLPKGEGAVTPSPSGSGQRAVPPSPSGSGQRAVSPSPSGRGQG
jgi:citronellol/citronellal dehydrogenase